MGGSFHPGDELGLSSTTWRVRKNQEGERVAYTAHSCDIRKKEYWIEKKRGPEYLTPGSDSELQENNPR